MLSKKLIVTTASLVAILAAVLAIGSGAPAAGANHPDDIRYEVSITNLTRGQIFSPAVVATHTRRTPPIFTEGQPASSELAGVAEDALLDPLVEALEASDTVRDVAVLTGVNGPILPGETASVEVSAGARASRVSLVGMLVTTNDGFYGLDGAAGPVHGALAYSVPAYDAGSEANNELCSHIPGPPCNSAGVRDTEGAEGYVHIHAGVHGVGDLDPAEHDWRNPVARVTIRRLLPDASR